MFKYNAGDIKQPKNLTKVVGQFKNNYLPRFQKLESYYRGDGIIKTRTMTQGKPNNKIEHDFARYITTMATGYFMGKPLVIDATNEKYKELLHGVLDFNYTDSMNFEISKEASKKGVAFEIMYLDEKGRLKTQKLAADEVIPIYSVNLGNFLECAVRIWDYKDISGEKTDYAELYTETEVYSYKKGKEDNDYILVDSALHKLSDIPVIVYWNNEEQTGDYENIISKIDAYDKAQSDTANDNEYFTDAYLVLTGASGLQKMNDNSDEDGIEAARNLRNDRLLFLDEKGQAEWLIKQVNDTAIENYKNRLYKDMFLLSLVPPMTDEHFAGDLTGIALRYKFMGLELLSMMKEHKFRAAVKKKLKIITSYINTLYNASYDPDETKITFERNFIDNETERIDNYCKEIKAAAELDGVTSKQTQLEQLPFIKDAQAELERIRQEILENDGLAKIPGGFYDEQ